MKATKRYSLTADGKVVEAGDPAGVRLLVGVGGEIPPEYESQINQDEPAPDKEPLVEVEGVTETKPTKAKAPAMPAKTAPAKTARKK